MNVKLPMEAVIRSVVMKSAVSNVPVIQDTLWKLMAKHVEVSSNAAFHASGTYHLFPTDYFNVI